MHRNTVNINYVSVFLFITAFISAKVQINLLFFCNDVTLPHFQFDHILIPPKNVFRFGKSPRTKTIFKKRRFKGVYYFSIKLKEHSPLRNCCLLIRFNLK